MATITLSSKHQVTLPVDMVRSLGLKAGDKLVAELIDDRIVIIPQPESWADYIRGSAKGVYGSTLEEIDAYIENERHGSDRWEWKQQFDDLVATESNVSAVVEALRSSPQRAAASSQLREHPLIREKRLKVGDISDALEELVEHGGVRKVSMDGQVTAVYRLVREFAQQ